MLKKVGTGTAQSATVGKKAWLSHASERLSNYTLKKEIERDLAKVHKILHEYKCDVIHRSTNARKSHLPAPSIFFSLHAEGSKKDHKT